jgi:hypothetical protein
MIERGVVPIGSAEPLLLARMGLSGERASFNIPSKNVPLKFVFIGCPSSNIQVTGSRQRILQPCDETPGKTFYALCDDCDFAVQ